MSPPRTEKGRFGEDCPPELLFRGHPYLQGPLTPSVGPALPPVPRGMDDKRRRDEVPKKIPLKGPSPPAKLVRQMVRKKSPSSKQPVGGRR